MFHDLPSSSLPSSSLPSSSLPSLFLFLPSLLSSSSSPPSSLCSLYCRDEKLLAQGIDPRQLRDAEEEVKLVFPPLPEASLAGTVPTSKQSPAKTRGAVEWKAPSKSLRRTGVAAASTVSEQPKPSDEINDRDLPSSTPAPPPLIVPIVTHSKDSAEGQSLFPGHHHHQSW